MTTVGSTALLIEPKSAADVNRLGEALAHPEPHVRAVAARVAGVLERTDLAPLLIDQLARKASHSWL